MRLEEFNQLDDEKAFHELQRCCGSTTWVNEMLARRPFSDLDTVFDLSIEIEKQMSEEDWLEAFSHHPQIGSVASLEEKFKSTASWSSSEQAAVKDATGTVIASLKKLNDDYFDKFGFIFIICASGKSADYMLGALRDRIVNDRKTEILNASCQQSKITRLRLEKLFS